MPTIDLNNSYTLLSIMKTVTPVPGFFRDRYFPTTPADMFNSDKVLTEYAKDDRKMAAFVAPVVGDIPVERDGYEIYEFTPAKIAPSRTLTVDDLNKKALARLCMQMSPLIPVQ